jgi:hypothetical protein
MIPTYIFNKEQLEQAIKACDNHITALQISNFTDKRKQRLEVIFTDAKVIFKDQLNDLYALAVAKEINTTYELVSNE